jgi:Cu2+-exporting ATPase
LLPTLPLVFGSDDVQHWLGYRAPSFPGLRLIPAIQGTIVLEYGGSVFIQAAWT